MINALCLKAKPRVIENRQLLWTMEPEGVALVEEKVLSLWDLSTCIILVLKEGLIKSV